MLEEPRERDDGRFRKRCTNFVAEGREPCGVRASYERDPVAENWRRKLLTAQRMDRQTPQVARRAGRDQAGQVSDDEARGDAAGSVQVAVNCGESPQAEHDARSKELSHG